MNEQRAKISVTPIANAEQRLLSAAGVLARYQPAPCCKLAAILKFPCVSDGSHDSRGSDKANAGDIRDFAACFALPMPLFDFRFDK